MDDNKKESKIDEMKDLLYSRKTGEIKEKRSILKRIKKKDLEELEEKKVVLIEKKKMIITNMKQKEKILFFI